MRGVREEEQVVMESCGAVSALLGRKRPAGGRQTKSRPAATEGKGRRESCEQVRVRGKRTGFVSAGWFGTPFCDMGGGDRGLGRWTDYSA